MHEMISRLSAGRIGEAYTLLSFFSRVFIIFVRSFQRISSTGELSSLSDEKKFLEMRWRNNVDQIHVYDKSRMREKETIEE